MTPTAPMSGFGKPAVPTNRGMPAIKFSGCPLNRSPKQKKFRTVNQICLGILLLLVVALGFVPTLILNVISRHNDALSVDIRAMKAIHSVYENFQETAFAFERYLNHATGDGTLQMEKLSIAVKKN